MRDASPLIDEILTFWLGTEQLPSEAVQERWWRKDPAFDDEIRRRFGATLERAIEGELDGWAETARGALALVLVLDQFSRNLFRGDARTWAQDERCVALAEAALEFRADRELTPHQRVFLYMPFMHAEDPAQQERCLALFEQLAASAPSGPIRDQLDRNVAFARMHRDIIARFGRFPHRNAILGRTSTPAELEFLTQPGSSF